MSSIQNAGIAEKRWLAALLFPLVVVLASCDDDHFFLGERAALQMDVVPAQVTLRENDTAQLAVTIRDRDGQQIQSPVTFTSSTPERVTVDGSGLVTAIWGGTTETITVSAEGVTRRIPVYLEEFPANVGFDQAALQLRLGERQQLQATVTCRNGHVMEHRLQWSTTDQAVAVVSGDGKVTAMGPGITLIRTKAGDVVGEVTVTVSESAAMVEVVPLRAHLRVQQRLELKARVSSLTGTSVDEAVTWQSMNPSIAEVDAQGIVTARAAGDVTILATAGERKGYALLTVDPPIARITITPPSTMLSAGATMQLAAATYTARGEAVAVPVVWRSTDENVAVVDANGIITGMAPGVVLIEALAEGAVGSVRLTIEPPAASVELKPSAATLVVGNSMTLEAVVRDAAGSVLHSAITWTASASEVATVNTTGVVTAWTAGTVVITAQVGTAVASATITVGTYPARIVVEPAIDTLYKFQSVQLAARVLDPRGAVLDLPVAWSTSDESVASVDATGLVTANHFGSADITATHEALTAVAKIVVLQGQPHGKVKTVVVTPGNGAIEVGGTIQLSASVLDEDDVPVETTIAWASDHAAIATVDATGKVTGVAEGQATITADAEGVKGSSVIVVKKKGGSPGGEEGFGNNLSNPAIFAEGIGLTGLSVSEDPGVRPTPEENVPVNGTSAFWYGGNVPDFNNLFYSQKSENVWRAEWMDGKGTMQNVVVDWGDNIESHTWNSHSVIRVETVLYSTTVPSLTGFNMVFLSGEGSTELQGATGTTASMTPTVFAVTPRLTIQRLNDETREPIPGAYAFNGTIAEKIGVDGPGGYAAEVNVAGKIVFGYNFFIRDIDVPLPEGMHKYGWWRITFALEPTATVGGTTVSRNVHITGIQASGENPLYEAQVNPAGTASWIDIYVEKGGGGGSGGKPVQSVTVHAPSSAVGTGGTVQLTATILDTDGNPAPDRSVSWASSKPSVATVDATGKVTALAPGTATIVATSEGIVGTIEITVIDSEVASVVIVDPRDDPDRPLAVGRTFDFDATVTYTDGRVVSDATVEWMSDRPEIATVDATGLVTGAGRGNVTITASLDGMTDAVDVKVVGGSGGGSGGGGGGSGGSGGQGDLYADLLLLYRDANGLPILRATAASTELCLQPVSYQEIPGIAPVVNPVNGVQVWLVPLIGDAAVAAAEEEVEACDPQPEYASYALEVDLERLNMARAPENVLRQHMSEVEALFGATDPYKVTLDAAGRPVFDGELVDAMPKLMGIHEALLETGTIPGTSGLPYPSPFRLLSSGFTRWTTWDLSSFTLGGAASKFGRINADAVLYHDRVMAIPNDADWAPTLYHEWLDEYFVDYSGFTYDRAATFGGCVTYIDRMTLQWTVGRYLDIVEFFDLGPNGPATARVAGYAQMAEDARAVIYFIHDNEALIDAAHIDSVGMNTCQAQQANLQNR